MSIKVLVRKVPYCDDDQEEVYPEPWLDWVNPATGAPLTDENYGYALGDMPEGAVVPTEDNPSGLPSPGHFVVTAEYVEEPDPFGEGTIKRRVLKASYNP